MALAFEKNSDSMSNHASMTDHAGMMDRAEAAGMEPAAGGELASAPSSPHGETRPTRVITPKPQLALNDQELRARVQWAHRASPHFQLAYDRAAFDESRAAMLNESLEIAHTLIFHFTHESFVDRFQVYVVDQRATGLLGRSVSPHFNLEERAIYLVESGVRTVHSELAGLLTHAMRVARYARHYHSTPGWAALEEGFSLFLSERLSTQPDLFPFYGAEPDVVAHHLYRKHEMHLARIWNAEAGTMQVRERVLVGAFMLYLGDTFSDDRVVTFSKSDDAITDETFRTFFDASLIDLQTAWLQHLPLTLVSLTEDEQSTMLQHWDRAIESSYH